MTNKNFTTEQKAANAKNQAESWSKKTSNIIVTAVIVLALIADSISNLF